jgi:subtilisin-like proprotein convertase family protein
MIGLGAKAEILTTNSYWQPVGGGISDQNPNGTNSVITVSGIVGTIENLSVFLNVTNGFNGDLYAYLVDPNGDFAVLLNRTGVDGTDPFGYGDGGFDVTFTLDSTTNIHFYQNFAYSLNGGGQLTGTWAVDGRNIDPMTNGAILASAPSTATLNSFFGTNPNGEWTLFIADMSGEYESIWNGWGLEIVSVPEPGTNLLLALGACGAAFFLRRKSRDVVR